ncbi:MAG: hypothetical protein VW271_04100, partial [Chloroflexota bacterium]
MTAAGMEPGDTLEVEAGTKIPVHATWRSHYGVERVEVVFNGKVIARQSYPEGMANGHLETEFSPTEDGWLAVRLGSGARDSFNQPIWAHTSP